MGGAAIAQESEVSPGSAVKFKDGGQDAVLVHLESGDFVAYSAVCTHQACTVAYKGGQLACPCHGSVFDPANGAEVVTGPAPSPLPEIPVEGQGRRRSCAPEAGQAYGFQASRRVGEVPLTPVGLRRVPGYLCCTGRGEPVARGPMPDA